jgi:hypothetical protein
LFFADGLLDKCFESVKVTLDAIDNVKDVADCVVIPHAKMRASVALCFESGRAYDF